MTSFSPTLFRQPAWRSSSDQASPSQVNRNGVVRPPTAVRWALIALLVGMIFTDRFGIPIGGFPLGASMPLAYALTLVLMARGWIVLDAKALVIYVGLVAVGGTTYLLNANVDGGNGTSVSSFLLLLALYFPFVFSVAPRADGRGHWLWVMRTASFMLLILALAGIAQFYLQFVFRPVWLFDISKLIPDPIHSPGVYNSAIPMGATFKANGIFSREPSNFSFWMALGFLIELALFKRMRRMACFALALMVSYSGTGLLTLAIGLLFPLRPKMLLWAGAAMATVLGGNALAGDPLHLAFTLGRLGEFDSQGSSAYARYVAPIFVVDGNFNSTPWSAWIGHGPGTIQKSAALFDSHDPTWAKLLFEYGLAGFSLCIGFMAYKLSRYPAPFQLRAVLFANWLVMGGYLLTPESVYTGFILLALWSATKGAIDLELQRDASA